MTKILAASAAASLAFAPLAAQAATNAAAPLSVSAASAAQMSDDTDGGDFIVIGLAVVAIVVGILIAFDVIGDDTPDSP